MANSNDPTGDDHDELEALIKNARALSIDMAKQKRDLNPAAQRRIGGDCEECHKRIHSAQRASERAHLLADHARVQLELAGICTHAK